MADSSNPLKSWVQTNLIKFVFDKILPVIWPAIIPLLLTIYRETLIPVIKDISAPLLLAILVLLLFGIFGLISYIILLKKKIKVLAAKPVLKYYKGRLFDNEAVPYCSSCESILSRIDNSLYACPNHHNLQIWINEHPEPGWIKKK